MKKQTFTVIMACVTLVLLALCVIVLPAQDYLEDGELGNLIPLPLQGQALKNGNSAFVDENWNAYPNQWTAFQVHIPSQRRSQTAVRGA